MTPTVLVSGVAFGGGLCLVWAWALSRQSTLARRLAPQLREQSTGNSTAASPQAASVLERLFAPALRDGVRAVERWGSPTRELDSRLRRAGLSISVDEFRGQQVVWAVLGLIGGVGLSIFLAASRGSAPLVLLVLTAVLGAAGFAARDYALSRDIHRRESAMVSELPTIAELLALSVGAGEGALGALERVAATTTGALSEELRHTLAAVRGGEPLSESLRSLAMRTGSPPVRRFAAAVSTAVERGTPLSGVLRAQAQDARAAGRRELMEQGGKKEIAMMVPVVFLILPVTVMFAVYPGLVAIDLGG